MRNARNKAKFQLRIFENNNIFDNMFYNFSTLNEFSSIYVNKNVLHKNKNDI